jgi:DNA-binding NarL/FixJ family response regulator
VETPALAARPAGDLAGRLRVVIADDNEGVRMLLRTLLELEQDFVVAGEAADGAAALALVGDEQPDLLILDLAMPQRDGLEVLEQLGLRHATTRVLVYSGFASSEVERTARRLGAVDYVVKGIDPMLLVERIRAAVH